MIPRSLSSLQDVIGTSLLVGSDEVRVVDTTKRLDLGHFLVDESLQGGFKNRRTVHGIGQVHAADVPTADGEIVRVNHRQHVMEGDIDLLVGLRIGSELDGRAHDNRAVVVGSTFAFTSGPDETATVGEDAGGDGGSIVTTQTDQHHADLADLALDLEVVRLLFWFGDKLTIGTASHVSSMIDILAVNLGVGINDVGRVNSEQRAGRSRPVLGAIGIFIRMRSHLA